MSKPAGNERYQRQISLKELGESGQQKLKNAKVLVVGAGGLGCPALLYLAGAGIGRIGIVDFDLVSLNNLHRQVLFSVNDIGLSKSLRAGDILGQINPDIEIVVFNQKLSNANALDIISGFDIIVDGTDNFTSRYMINDACVLLNKTLVYGAISRFEGQLAVFNKPSSNAEIPSNYRDLFPLPPADDEVLNCEEAGVIGVLPGIIGTMMANETIKLITGIGEPLLNRLLTYNSLNNHFFEMELMVMPETAKMIPADADAFKDFNYDWFCSINSNFDLRHEDFELMMDDKDIQIVDVRETGEMPAVDDFDHIHIPLSHLKVQIPDIDAQTIVLFCQSGKRSTGAAEILSKHYGKSRKIYSLKDGIAGWQKNK
ncbi:adenylyltransferase and sulfurtransferase [Daejeonella rubra]|uniref:Molybdopterin-synthase adenylyltransferase n=1 Tax=Daejeonella rubra TaxID=990371 RepID=A0A1G9TBA4_9SPHI|nr:HesA/MoeB/ThiF family protein [Daejeonella rubra]SDM44993.1 adenylyltransferase and sulfurtransferase [Daejeonella rubra]